MASGRAIPSSAKHEADTASSPASKGVKRPRVGSVEVARKADVRTKSGEEDKESAHSDGEHEREKSDDDDKLRAKKPRKRASGSKVPSGLTCSECGVKCANGVLMTEHGRKTNHRPFACQHEGCTKKYSKREHLNRHFTAIHNHDEKGKEEARKERDARKRFNCEMCQARFTYKHGLTRHIKQSHKNVNLPFKCTTCLLGFKKKSDLQAHSYVHTGVLPFECEDCGERFLKRYLLIRHERKHGSETASQTQAIFCQADVDCGEIFFSLEEQLEHERIAHPAAKTAETAEIDVDDGAEVDKKAKERETRPTLECRICERTFQRKHYLRAHLRTHFKSPDERKQFICPMPECGKAYTRGSNLMTHYNAVHDPHKSKRFACPRDGCDARFGYKTVLIRHIDKIHDNPQPPKWRERKSAGALERALGVNEVGDAFFSSESAGQGNGEKRPASMDKELAGKPKRFKFVKRIKRKESAESAESSEDAEQEESEHAEPVESAQVVELSEFDEQVGVVDNRGHVEIITLCEDMRSTDRAEQGPSEEPSKHLESTKLSGSTESGEQIQGFVLKKPSEDVQLVRPNTLEESTESRESAEIAVELAQPREQVKSVLSSDQMNSVASNLRVKSTQKTEQVESTDQGEYSEPVEQPVHVEPLAMGEQSEADKQSEPVESSKSAELDGSVEQSERVASRESKEDVGLTETSENSDATEKTGPLVVAEPSEVRSLAVPKGDDELAEKTFGGTAEQRKRSELIESVGAMESREVNKQVEAAQRSEQAKLMDQSEDPGSSLPAEHSTLTGSSEAGELVKTSEHVTWEISSDLAGPVRQMESVVSVEAESSVPSEPAETERMERLEQIEDTALTDTTEKRSFTSNCPSPASASTRQSSANQSKKSSSRVGSCAIQ